MEKINPEERDELITQLENTKMIQKMNEIEIFNNLRNILVDMGYLEDLINKKTNLENDLGFDYLDLADFLIRIEIVFKIQIDVNLLPNFKYPQFESIGSTIDFLLKEYNII